MNFCIRRRVSGIAFASCTAWPLMGALRSVSLFQKSISKVNSMNSGERPRATTAVVARYAMMSSVPTLLVAVVTFIAIMSSACPPATGAGLGCGAVSRFVCVHCTSTGKLSSRGLFLARAAVRRHIRASKSCREAGLGFREVHVEARAGDVMAGAGGAAGPAPDVRHQPPGEKECFQQNKATYTV